MIASAAATVGGSNLEFNHFRFLPAGSSGSFVLCLSSTIKE
jgi:hypothetical protein